MNLISDLNKLKTFSLVCQEGSLLTASQKLNVTNAAIHTSIKKLENEMGVILFQRQGKKYIPTYEGEKLYKSVQPFFNSLDDCVEELKDDGEIKGQIRLGCPNLMSKYKLMPALKKFKKLYPAVTFDLFVGETLSIKRFMMESKLDLAIVDEGDHIISLKNFEQVVVSKEEFVMCCEKKFHKKWIEGKKLTYDYLAQVPHLAYNEKREGISKWYLHQFDRMAPNKNIQVFNNVEIMKEAVIDGWGLAMMPEFFVEKEIKSGKLIKIQKNSKKLFSKLVLLRHLDHVPLKREKVLFEFLKSI